MTRKTSSQPKLVIVSGKEKGKVIPLQEGEITLGRSRGEILVADPRVSRAHVSLTFDASKNELRFQDLKSLNGTFRNGERWDSGVLRDGDQLQVGDTLFDCQITVAAATTSASASVSPSKLATPPVIKTTPTPSAAPKQPRLVPLDENGSGPRDIQLAAHSIPVEPGPGEDFASATSDRLPRQHDEKANKQKTWLRLPPLPPMTKQTQRRVWIGAALVGVAVLYVGMQGPNPKELQRELKSLRSLESEGKLDEALDRAEELRNKFPESPQTLAFLGHLYATQRRVPEAIEAYEKSLQARPDQSLVPLRLIRLYLQSGQSENAQRLLKDVDRRVQSGEVNREFLVEAAEMFLDFKDLLKGAPKAVILAKALQKEVAPRSTIGYKLEAQVLLTEMQEKQDTNAPNPLAMAPQVLTTLQAGLAIDPSDDWLLENLSFVKLTMRDSAGAMEAVGKWIQYHPSASKPLLVMAYLKFNEKDLEGSFAFIERLFKVSKENPRDPMYAEALHLAGQVKSDSPQESQAFFKRACALGYKASCERVTASDGAGENPATIQPSPPPGAAPAP